MATREQLINALRKADAAGDVEAARAIARRIRDAEQQPQQSQQERFEAERARLLKEQADETGGLEAFAVGAGRGLANIGRGISRMFGGDAGPDESEDRALAALKEARPYSTGGGEIIGETAPFLAAAPLTGAGLATAGGRQLIPAATNTLSRVALGSGLGATQAGLSSAGRGESADEVITNTLMGGALGGAAEVALPLLGRGVRAVADRLGLKVSGPLVDASGAPTAKMREAMEKAGVSWDDLTAEAQALTSARSRQAGVRGDALSPEAAAREASFKSMGIPYTLGDINQDFAQQATEQRLLQMASGDAGESLRGLKSGQSESFKARLDDLVSSLGDPNAAGESVKAAASGLKKSMASERRALYKQFADADPTLKSVPLDTSDIKNAIPDADTLADLEITAPEAVKKVKAALARFGIIDGDDSAQPLTIGNFDRFRKMINVIERSDNTGAAKVATSPIKSALDGEVDLIEKAVKSVPALRESSEVLSGLERARAIVRAEKTEFTPNTLFGKLTEARRDGVTPLMEASKVADWAIAKGTPVEQLQESVRMLRKAGENGHKGLQDLRAATVMKALDDSLGAVTNKMQGGAQGFSPVAFIKSLEKIGDDKLGAIFGGDDAGKAALAKLRAISARARDTVPTNAAVPKGSAPVIMDALSKMGVTSMPAYAQLNAMVKAVVGAGSDAYKVQKAINAKPQFKAMATRMRTDYPRIASALGIASLGDQRDQKEERQ